MGKFYIRVYKDDKRERTWGCGSRGQNSDNLATYLINLEKSARKYIKAQTIRFSNNIRTNPSYPFGNTYRIELVRNRNGEKKVYYEITLDMPFLTDRKDVYIITHMHAYDD